jgi:rod shape-determining protein MreD
MSSVDFQEKLNGLWRGALVHLSTLLLLLLSTVSFAAPYISQVRPFLVLMAVYYWAIYRPTIMPPLVVFLMGLMLDILTYAPLGLNALLLVAVQWIVRGQRVFLTGQPFIMIWIGFGFTATLFASAQFLIYLMTTAGAPLPTQALVASTALTFALFPAASLVFVWLHRLLPHAARA